MEISWTSLSIADSAGLAYTTAATKNPNSYCQGGQKCCQSKCANDSIMLHI